MMLSVKFDFSRAMLFEPSYDDAGLIRLWLMERKIEVVEWTRVGLGWAERWKRAKPSLNIIEMVLPKLDGIACAKKIKAVNSNYLVLLMHSFEGALAADVTRRALEAGVDAVVPKPLQKGRFMASLDFSLERID